MNLISQKKHLFFSLYLFNASNVIYCQFFEGALKFFVISCCRSVHHLLLSASCSLEKNQENTQQHKLLQHLKFKSSHNPSRMSLSYEKAVVKNVSCLSSLHLQFLSVSILRFFLSVEDKKTLKNSNIFSFHKMDYKNTTYY